MKVLWVSAEPPDRQGGGGNIRQAHLLSAVADRHETHLVLAGRLRDEQLCELLADVVEVAGPRPEPPRSTWSRRMLDLRLAGPEGPPERYDGRAARRALGEQLPHGFDVVVVQHAGLASLLPERRDGAWVCELHNVESVTLDALAGIATGSRQRRLQQMQARRARRFERWIVDHYDRVVTVSADDAAALPGPSHVVPNGVDLQRWTASPPPAEPRVVFTGTLSYLPNVDGIRWFCADVWPLVRRELPAAVLDVVGRAPVAAVRELDAVEGVAVHGDVPEVTPFVAAARAAVVPLRIGSGSRLKVLESWAAQRPVVGTSIGLAGLGVVDGVNALVRDDAASFANAVVDLLRADGPAQQLAHAGRRAVEDGYDWRRIGAAYADWLATG